MDIRAYQSDTDFDSVLRIWREIGWIDTSDAQKESLESFISVGSAEVALVDGEAECLVHRAPGTLRHTTTDLAFCGIMAVTTSRIARKLGMATELTARALAQGREAGAAVAGLGMFEQGFYDRFGFGTGSYEHRMTFDPGSLRIDVPYRTPVRVTPDDWEDAHAALAGRMRAHGSLTMNDPEVVKAEMGWMENPFGLGYRDGDGRLTHFVAGPAKGENGPYTVWLMAYENPHQLMELLSLLKALGDQVASVVLMEPPEIQLQDLVGSPIRQRIRTIKSEHESIQRALAFWQFRVLDLAACVGAHAWPGPEVSFNLVLHDPLSGLVDGAGIDGEYIVTVGAPSSVESGRAESLPTLEASVNAFTRLWFGVRSASSLAITDRLDGPIELLESLDVALRLPQPRMGWFI